MQSIWVVIMMMMIMLGCTGTPDKVCSVKCFFECITSKDLSCYHDCKEKCNHRSLPGVYYECINGCGMTKSTIGIYFLTTLFFILIFYMYYLWFNFVTCLHRFNNLLLCIRWSSCCDRWYKLLFTKMSQQDIIFLNNVWK